MGGRRGNVDCKQTFSAFLPRHLYLFYLLTMLYPVLKKTEIKKEEEQNYTTNAFVHMRPSGQNRQKNSLKERVFIILALKIRCHFVKNTLL